MQPTRQAAREAARAAYLAAVPEPDPLDGKCSTCRARPGRACHNQGKEVPTHQARTTKAARAAGRRNAEADLAGQTAALIQSALSMGEPAERITEWVAKQPRAAAAYLGAAGWRPVSHSAQSPWRSPSAADQTDYPLAEAVHAAIEAATVSSTP